MKTVLALSLMCVLLIPGIADSQGNETSASDREQAQAAYNKLGTYPEYHGDLKSLSAVNIRNAKMQLITDQLDKPWAMEFIDEERIIISELSGRLKLLNLQDNTLVTVNSVPEIPTNGYQIGLLDVEVHPDFANNQTIYFSFSKADAESKSYYTLAVAKARLTDNRLEQLTTIFAANPYTWSPSNFGGALEFDNQGHLFLATGDRSESTSSQNTNILQGKILRLNDDGSAAAGNPFADDPAIDDRIYATGVRNPQGLHFDAPSGLLFEAEHGPMGGDEVNIIKAGANYGWPTVTYGLSYTTNTIGEGTHKTGMTQPLFYYLPSEAISPLTVYRGDMFQEWNGDILVGALKGNHVSKLDYDAGMVRSEYPILTEIDDRIRDIKVAADGSIYVLSQKGQLNRLYREGNQYQPVEDTTDGATVYVMACAGCHDAGSYGSPKLGDKPAWEAILSQALETTYANTINGKNAMPPRGYCNICSDEHLQKAVDYMLQQVK
jgi:glucose/arabinose dehydrogenase